MLINEAIKELQNCLPSENILTRAEDCQAYSCDESNVQHGLPDIVIFAQKTEDVQKVVTIAKKYKIPLVCRGAGTNTVGACVTLSGGIILNFSKMNKIIKINRENMTVRVQPGVVVGDLQAEVEKLGLYYPPDPSYLAFSTIGGSIAQNSAGARTFKYGSTRDYVIDLEIVNSSGDVFRTGSNTIKNSTGYNLSNLFVGSEGTLGIVVEATLKLIVKPQTSKVIMAYFDSIEDAADAVTSVIEQQVSPSTIDFMDKNAIQTIEKYNPAGLITEKDAALIIELDGFECAIQEQKEIIMKVLKDCGASTIEFSATEEDAERIWKARRLSMKSCARIKPNVTTDDVIVPRENLSKLIKGIQDICKKYDLTVCMVGHVGDGSVHPQIPIDYNDTEEYKKYRLAKSEIYDLTVSLDGTLSGEHGIGLEKREFITKVVDLKTLAYMREIKKIFDPDNILNPYKIF